MTRKSPFTETMFADSFLETSWDQQTSRSWTTLTSFGLQVVIISLLLILPLLKNVAQPSGRVLPTPLSWGAPPPPPVPPHQRSATVMQSNLADNVIIAPPSIPSHVAIIDEVAPPPQLSFNTWGVRGGTGTGGGDGVTGMLNDLDRAAPPPPQPPAPPARHFRPSNILEGSLIRRVQPSYPTLARTAHIQGSVVLSAVISKAGTIENLQVLSGHPMLVAAAVEAVRQWRYRPYILNSEPVEVETQITVNFTLSGN